MPEKIDWVAEHDNAYRKEYFNARQEFAPDKMNEQQLRDTLISFRNSLRGQPSTHTRIARIYAICDEMKYRGICQDMIGEGEPSKEFRELKK